MNAFVLFIGIIWYTHTPGVMPDVITVQLKTPAECVALEQSFKEAVSEEEGASDSSSGYCKPMLVGRSDKA